MRFDLCLALASAAAVQPAVPALTGRVVDAAEILDASTESALADLLQIHEASTSNQVAVLILPSLDGTAIEPFATDVFRAWGLGQTDRDNGVLLLVARDGRELRIEVGYGPEGTLTDAKAARIVRDVIVPAFRAGDFEGGVLAGAEVIVGTLDGTYAPPEASSFTFNGRPGEETRLLDRLVFAVLLPGSR